MKYVNGTQNVSAEKNFKIIKKMRRSKLGKMLKIVISG